MRLGFILIGFVTVLVVSLFTSTGLLPTSSTVRPPTTGSGATTDGDTEGGIRVEFEFFAEAHSPYGTGLPGAVLDRIWEAVHNLAPTTPLAGGVEPDWELVGPIAMLLQGEGNQYCGRVRDVEGVTGWDDIRIAAASGGLWETDPDNPGYPVPISDQLESLAIGSFASNPADRDVIVVGTGEPGLLSEPDPGEFYYIHLRTGVGVRRTEDGGQTWSEVNMVGVDPRSVYRIRWDPQVPNRVHLVAHNGYWRSDDGGEEFERLQEGVITDIAFHPFDSQRIWIGRWHETDPVGTPLGGIYHSTDGGDSWMKITDPALPITDMGRISLATAPDPSGPWIYAAMARHSDPNPIFGFFRSVDGGQNWTELTQFLPDGYLERQGFFNNTVAADPDHPEIVLLGWVRLHRSTDGGLTWAEPPSTDQVHSDQHSLRWADDESLLLANDGGVFNSTGWGDWLTHPWIPITQFYQIDVQQEALLSIAGGSQDNGIAYAKDAFGDGLLWFNRLKGDGEAVVIWDDHLWATNGVNDGDHTYKNWRSSDQGLNMEEVLDELPGTTQWFREVDRKRGVLPDTAPIYTHSGEEVFEFDHDTDTWFSINAPFSHTIKRIEVVGSLAMWVTTTAENVGEDRVLYRDTSGLWDRRSDELPDGFRVRKVCGDPYGNNPQLGYAIMEGLHGELDGNRIWKTTNGGTAWTNITGNLPNMPIADLVENPVNDDVLYIASLGFGCFKSVDGGASWLPWNAGWPQATIVTDMVPVFDPLDDPNRYWIYAGTFGRSAWRRSLEFTTSSTGGGSSDPPLDEPRLSVSPNPFKHSATIEFELKTAGDATVMIYDVAGRQVRNLASGRHLAGIHRVEWDGQDDRGRTVAAGSYFARSRTAKGQAVRLIVRLEDGP